MKLDTHRDFPRFAHELQDRRAEILRAESVQTAYHPSYDFMPIRRSRQHTATEFTDFVRDVRDQFTTLASQPHGESLLSQIDQNARRRKQANRGQPEWRRRPDLSVHIFDSVADNDGGGVQIPVGLRRSQYSTQRGAGSDVFVRRVGVAPSEFDQPYRPAFISTGHELVHALRAQMGKQLESRMEEELETVGGIFRSPSPQGVTENSLRAEHNLPKRTRY